MTQRVATNQHSDVTAVSTDTTGATVGSWTYDPFGMVSYSTGTSLVGLGFQSSYTDSISGLVNMGVRSYSAGYGRFTAPDVVTRAVSNPGSFNRFLYANGSPVNATDPTGYWPDWRKAAAAALKGPTG